MFISIITAKICAFILHLFGKGATTLPGKIALKLKHDILKQLSFGVKIICVTGTNGKTTTCALLEHALKENGISYFINKSGANMITGVATAFIMNSTLLGKCKKEYAILECDENSLPLISKYIDAKIVAVTNIFRDQLDRYGEISHTLNKIKEGIINMPESIVILNADCPLTYSISRNIPNKILTFGVNAGNTNTNIVSDSLYCPVCQSRLYYKSRAYAQLGDYFCPKCNYKRVRPNTLISDITNASELGSSFILNSQNESALLSTSLGGIYNIYNFCAAAAVLNALKIDNISSLCRFSGAFGRMERFKNGKQTILLLLVKNPVGLSSCIKYVCAIKGGLDIAFALNDNEADGRDVSWIWDSDFSPIRAKTNEVYTIGTRSYDMALRLKYDEIKATRAVFGENYKELIKIIKHSNHDFVVFSTYTSMMNMRHYFIESFGGREFWE